MTQRISRRRRPRAPSRLARLLGALKRRIRITNRDGTWRIVVLAAPAVPEEDARPAPQAAGPLAEMRSELTRALDRHRMSRRVMPALALLERALRRSGGRGVARLAAPVLWDAVNQLDVLAENWEGTQLATLRRHLIAALGLDEAGMDMLRANDDAPAVDDACLTDFMQAMEAWDCRLATTGGPGNPGTAAVGC